MVLDCISYWLLLYNMIMHISCQFWLYINMPTYYAFEFFHNDVRENVLTAVIHNRFLDGTLDVKRRDEVMDEPNTSKSSRSWASDQILCSAARESSLGKGEDKNKADKFMHYLSEQIDNVVHALAGSGEFPRNIQYLKLVSKKLHPPKGSYLLKDLKIYCSPAISLSRLQLH